MKRGIGNMRLMSAGLLGFGVMLAIPAWVQMQAEEASPSAARAVRLSSVDGKVQLSQGSEIIADPALANTPLFEGTQVATGDDGRAEVQFEDGSTVRIAPNSSVTLTVLGRQGTATISEVALEGGLGYFELQADHPGSGFRVRFNDALVTVSGFTVLRIGLDNPPGELAVFSGNAHLERGSAISLDLHGGESVALNGADSGHYSLLENIEPDSWDSWNSDRDQALTTEAASKTSATSGFLDANNPAWNTLDANGNWYNVPGQGYVWSPYEAGGAGWDPYGSGHWMWTPRFGYIWVSSNSWGYLPYQCGAWSYFDSFGWVWAPGGCNPWWGGGGGEWYSNVVYPPSWYAPPIRPRGRPLPRAPITRAPIKGGGKFGPYPLVAVNRKPAAGATAHPVQDRNAPVTIAGHVVQPLNPIVPRPIYDRPVAGGGPRQPGNPREIYPGGVNPGGGYMGGRLTGARVSPPGQVNGGARTGPAPYQGTPGGNGGRAPSMPSSHPSGGGGGSAPSAPSHAPSGGGFSGGGGGGGGGGSHPSGGGGPHH